MTAGKVSCLCLFTNFALIVSTIHQQEAAEITGPTGRHLDDHVRGLKIFLFLPYHCKASFDLGFCKHKNFVLYFDYLVEYISIFKTVNC